MGLDIGFWIAAIISTAVGLFISYWVIRLAVRHALNDARAADDERARSAEAVEAARRRREGDTR